MDRVYKFQKAAKITALRCY